MFFSNLKVKTKVLIYQAVYSDPVLKLNVIHGGNAKQVHQKNGFSIGEHSNQEVYLKNVTDGAFEGEFCLKLRGTKWTSNRRRSSMEKCCLSPTKLILGGTHC